MNRDEEKGPEPQVGMQAEATQGDLGEADVSKPRVKHVQRDEAGQVVSMVIQKGVLLRKEMEVPAERIEQITQASRGEGTGTAIVQMSQQETEALTSQGSETVSAPTDALGQVEERLPTAEGLRRQERQSQTRKPAEQVKRSWWQVLGPGFLSGMAGNDASASAGRPGAPVAHDTCHSPLSGSPIQLRQDRTGHRQRTRRRAVRTLWPSSCGSGFSRLAGPPPGQTPGSHHHQSCPHQPVIFCALDYFPIFCYNAV